MGIERTLGPDLMVRAKSGAQDRKDRLHSLGGWWFNEGVCLRSFCSAGVEGKEGPLEEIDLG